VPNDILYNLRDARGETQHEVARALIDLAADRGVTVGCDSGEVSRWERGLHRPQGIYRQLLAQHFGVSIAELGLTRQRLSQAGQLATVAPALGELTVDAMTDDYLLANQASWLGVRTVLNSRRVDLARATARLYPREIQFDGYEGFLTSSSWLANRPVELPNVNLNLDKEARPADILGTEHASAQTRPLQNLDSRYSRYSHAVRDLARPTLFENRVSWRLLKVSWSERGGQMSFGDMTYFDAIDICEAVAHETAKALLRGPASEVAPASWRSLDLRRLIGDPFDTSRRPILASINTLTIRRDVDGASFVLHDRDPAHVTVAGGMLHVMPAGVFQPASVRSATHRSDFNLWHNMLREYSEEFLGNAEHCGGGQLIDYLHDDPFASFSDAHKAGAIRPYCFGVGLDALTLFGEILTVTVFDGPTYDTLFANLVRRNSEGSVVHTGVRYPTSAIPFTEHVVRELLEGGRMAPSAAACLKLAWEHRRELLND
jgi:transcriptional regulator with XRE-family HTH domain